MAGKADTGFGIHISVILIGVIILPSCVLFQPLPIDPPKNNITVQKIGPGDFSKFNGDYSVISVDSNSYTLDFIFTNKEKFSWKHKPGANDFIRLQALQDGRLKAVLFINNKPVKTKNHKILIQQNSINYHNANLHMRYVFFLYAQQTNRISLSPEGDLLVDTNRGGIASILFIPIPFSGASYDQYGLRFKRIK